MATSVEAPIKVIIGGYSLAGLFALWAGYQPDQPFDAVVAASPSVWYQDWLDYAAAHQPQSGAFYLSLGDREERSRPPHSDDNSFGYPPSATTFGAGSCRQHSRVESRQPFPR